MPRNRKALFAAAITGVVCLAASHAARAEDLKIGYITDLSGPLAGSYTPTWQGFELYFKALNDKGGIDGRKVALTLDDDGLRADRAVAGAKKQIVQNGVLGIFGLSLSSTQGPVATETRKDGVPVVSSFSAVADALPPAKPYYYSTGVMFEVAGEAIAELSHQIKPSGKIVGLTFDSVGGRAALQTNRQMAEKMGYSWDEVIFPVRTSDYTAIGQRVAALNPDIVVGHYGAEQNLGVITALRASGYIGPYVIASYGASEATVKQAAEQAGSNDNLYMVSRYVPMTDDAAGTRAIKDAAAKYGITNPTSMHVTGWVLGKFAATALARCGADCTRESFNKVMESLSVDTDGLTGGPIEMAIDDHYGPTYWRLYKWNGAKLEPQGEWDRKQGLSFTAAK